MYFGGSLSFLCIAKLLLVVTVGAAFRNTLSAHCASSSDTRTGGRGHIKIFTGPMAPTMEALGTGEET